MARKIRLPVILEARDGDQATALCNNTVMLLRKVMCCARDSHWHFVSSKFLLSSSACTGGPQRGVGCKKKCYEGENSNNRRAIGLFP